jgi:hypothetical protein
MLIVLPAGLLARRDMASFTIHTRTTQMFAKSIITAILAGGLALSLGAVPGDAPSRETRLDAAAAQLPSCCIKRSYCCSQKMFCCPKAAQTVTVGAAVAAETAASPSCCIKRSYCCSQKMFCCPKAAIHEDPGAVAALASPRTEESVARPSCCIKHSYCCSVQRFCCPKGGGSSTETAA